MPLAQTARNAAPDVFFAKIRGGTHTAADKSVQKTVIEAGKEWRGEVEVRECAV
jgi:hypothetical protein